MNFEKQIFSMARQDLKTLVFPEANFSDSVLKAVKILAKKRLAKVILVGEPSVVFNKNNILENDFIQIIDPKTSELKTEVAKKIYETLSEQITQEEASDMAENPYYFATGLLMLNYADGLISGSESISLQTYRPVFELMMPKNNDKFVSTAVLFVDKHNRTPLLLSDCEVIVNPTSQNLVDIANNAVEFWKMLFITEPKVAFLSYSTNGSATGESVNKMKMAHKLFNEKFPKVISEGEMQLDTALNPKAQAKKFFASKIKGDANILVAPDINSGNLLESAIHIFGGFMTVGCIGLGLNKPVTDLSRTATIEEIVLVSAITAIQAQD